MKIGYRRDICIPIFITELFTITIVQQPKYTLGLILGQGGNQDHASCEAQSAKKKKKRRKRCGIYYGILFSQEKEGNSAICNNSDGP